MNLKVDPAVPLLTITAPADNSTSNKPFVTVSGAIDPNGTVEIAVNQGTPQVAAITANSFTQTVNLASGLNTLEITATDLAGKKNSLKRSVISSNQHPTIDRGLKKLRTSYACGSDFKSDPYRRRS